MIETFNFVPAGVIIINNQENKVKFANTEILNIFNASDTTEETRSPLILLKLS